MMNIVLVNGVLLWAGATLALRFFPETRSNSWGLLALTGFFFVCLIVGIQSVLGWFDVLNHIFVSVCSYAIGGLITFCWGREAVRSIEKVNFDTDRLTRIIIGVGFFLLLIELFNALITPVWEYDSIAYHLPMARHWYLTESIRGVYFSVFAGPIGYYPGTGELLLSWTMILLGTDQYANALNVFLVPLFFATGIFALQRRGMRVRFALFFPTLFLLTPLVLRQLGTPLVDLFFVYVFLCMLLFLDMFFQQKSSIALCLFLCAFGLFVGTKYLGIAYAPIVCIPFFIGVFKSIQEVSIRQSVLRACIAGCMGFIVLGGHWYIRNYLLTSNPIFPATVALGPVTILEGYRSYMNHILELSYLSRLPSFTDDDKRVMSDLVFRRVGYALFAFFFAYVFALLLLIKDSLQRVSRLSSNSFLLLFFVIALPYGVYAYISAPNTAVHFDANLRYCLPVILLSYLLLVELCARIDSRKRYWVLVTALVMGVLSVIGFLHVPDLPFETLTMRYAFQSPLLFITFAATEFFIVMWAFLFWRSMPRWGFPVLLVLLSVAMFMGKTPIHEVRDVTTFETLKYKYPGYVDLLTAFEWADTNIDDAAVIAFTGFHLQYPLVSRSLQRDVRYVHVNSCFECGYAEFRSEADGIFAHADRADWIHNLTSTHVQYLVYYDDFGLQRYVREWVSQLPQQFPVVYQQRNVIVYRFIP